MRASSQTVFAGRLVEQQDEAAVDRQRLEGDVHHPRQHLVDRIGADEEPREARHEAEDLARIGLVEVLALGRARLAGGLAVEPPGGAEVGERTHDGRRSDRHLRRERLRQSGGRQPGARGRSSEPRGPPRPASSKMPTLIRSPGFSMARLLATPLTWTPFVRHQVLDEPATALVADDGMAARDREIGQHDLVLRAAPDAQLVRGEWQNLVPALNCPAQPEHGRDHLPLRS